MKWRMNRSLLCAIVVSVTSFWFAHGAKRLLHSEWGNFLEANKRPVLFNGLPLILDPFVEPPLIDKFTRYLVIVSSDECAYSQREVTNWTRLLREAPFSAKDVVISISTVGTKIPSQLESILSMRRVAFRRQRVTNIGAFGQQTGVSWTPQTLVLDKEMRVRLQSEKVTQVVFEEVLRQLSIGGSNSGVGGQE